jgi:sn-glycerol 3-phosphate transport system permease protein
MTRTELKKMKPSQARAVQGWLLLLPTMALLTLFTYWPAVSTIIDSFMSTPRSGHPSVFVGLDNYEQMIGDSVFWRSATNNLWFALGTVPISMAIAITMALWVNDKIAARSFVRAAFFAPTVLPMIAVANLWLFFYTPQFGFLEQVRGAFGLEPRNWVGSADTALLSVIVVAIWKESGFFMIFYLAALQSISPTLGEAARVEGASRMQFLWRVQLPLLMPTTLFVLINAAINAFRMVDHIFVLTRGGPDNASTLLLFHIYNVAFSYWETGYASALTVVLLGVLALIALVQYGFLERRVHYR